DMFHRVIPDSEWLSRISPVYYYNASKPLVPSYGTNVGAMLILLALSVLLSGVAIWLFVRRDVGRAVAVPGWLRLPERAIRPERALPANAWSLRSIYTRSLAMIAVPTFWWTLAIAGFVAWMLVVVQRIEEQLTTILESSPVLKDMLTRVGGSEAFSNASILSA